MAPVQPPPGTGRGGTALTSPTSEAASARVWHNLLRRNWIWLSQLVRDRNFMFLLWF